MDSERWEQVKSILQDAHMASGADRSRILDERCQGDADLRKDVESLLAGYDRRPEFLETPAATLAGQWLAPAPEQLGAYRIVRLIGSGGMADVYLAERSDGVFEKQVAVKVMKFGLLDPVARWRFELERQLAASLDHPNVAKLLDGGVTPDERPYFVMDLVEGSPLNEWAKAAALADRLRLFAEICDGVEYVHRRGVVHRDLKPANILVSCGGEPKLLDFGIAKLLKPDETGDGATRTSFRPLTPEYASPEQIPGSVTGPASDVYSLGLLLHELVTLVPRQAGGRPSGLERMPRSLARMVEKATTESPEERLSAAELGTAVKRWVESPPWDFPRIPEYWGVTVGLVALLAAAIAGTWLWASRPNADRSPGRSFPLTNSPGIENMVDLSRDGGVSVYVAPGEDNCGASRIFVKPVAGGEPRILTGRCAAYRWPRWSPDGSWIAYARESEGAMGIFLIPSAGGEERQVARVGDVALVPDREIGWQAWTADGKAGPIRPSPMRSSSCRSTPRSADGSPSPLPEPLETPRRWRLPMGAGLPLSAIRRAWNRICTSYRWKEASRGASPPTNCRLTGLPGLPTAARSCFPPGGFRR